ncbi:hypothetical protein ASG59_18650 [Methylobacterium sp. Leaf466]|nr:hypothetical protein ASG59_18650 [Methylobacterium sp. Leaf466]
MALIEEKHLEALRADLLNSPSTLVLRDAASLSENELISHIGSRARRKIKTEAVVLSRRAHKTLSKELAPEEDEGMINRVITSYRDIALIVDRQS